MFIMQEEFYVLRKYEQILGIKNIKKNLILIDGWYNNGYG